MGRKLTKNMGLTAVVGMSLALAGCPKKSEEASSATTEKYLYISSGTTNSGFGVTTFAAQTSGRKVSKLGITSKSLSTVIDLTLPFQGGPSFGIDTGAQSLIDKGTYLLMLTENAVAGSDRKVYKIPKSSPYNTEIYSQDPLALTTVAANITRTMQEDVDGTLILSRTTAVEKIGTNSVRIPIGGNAWMNAPAAPCATSIAGISAAVVMPPFGTATSGKIIYAHMGATTALNRLGVISATGYLVAADCLVGIDLSTVGHTPASNIPASPAVAFLAASSTSPTAMVFIPNATGGGGKLIVGYGPSTAANAILNNSVNLHSALVMWTVNETATTASLVTPVVLNRDNAATWGISALAYDSSDSSLYVATAGQPGVASQIVAGYGYKIEKFTIDTAAQTASLVRVDNLPFLVGTSATRGITSMAIGSQ
jgi:hypothetical protein